MGNPIGFEAKCLSTGHSVSRSSNVSVSNMQVKRGNKGSMHPWLRLSSPLLKTLTKYDTKESLTKNINHLKNDSRNQTHLKSQSYQIPFKVSLMEGGYI